MVENVDVELTLPRQAGKGEIAAAQVADYGTNGVVSIEKIEFSVEGVAEKQLDDNPS